jgi:hypothetical protein
MSHSFYYDIEACERPLINLQMQSCLPSGLTVDIWARGFTGSSFRVFDATLHQQGNEQDQLSLIFDEDGQLTKLQVMNPDLWWGRDSVMKESGLEVKWDPFVLREGEERGYVDVTGERLNSPSVAKFVGGLFNHELAPGEIVRLDMERTVGNLFKNTEGNAPKWPLELFSFKKQVLLEAPIQGEKASG